MNLQGIKFVTFTAIYGGADKIPNPNLYAYLEANRENLINESQLGVNQVPESDLGREVIRRSKSDLMWLTRYFLWRSSQVNDTGEKDISLNLIDEKYYQPVIDLFVQKDCAKPISKQSEIKTRLLLWPRSGMKSTIDHMDAVQWILNWPEIRILYLTAEAGLAKGFVGEIKNHFQIKEGDPTWMNLFFPSFCFEMDKEAANVFTCPLYKARNTKRKEATVTASSVGKHKAGRHYEVIKADDAVSDVNTVTSEQCIGISEKLYLAEKLLDLGGYYVDYIGTRYHDMDHYGKILEQNAGSIEIQKGDGWTLHENHQTSTKILIGRACQIKPEIAEQLEKEERPVTYQEAGEDGCILLLPHIMPFSWCMADFTKNERTFEGQRNQNTSVSSQIEFTRLLLLKNTVPYTEIPKSGPITQVWDFAFSQKKGRDYSTGCTVLWDKDEHGDPVGYVLEVVRDRFNPSTLAKAVAAQAARYHPIVVGIEKAAGSDFLGATIALEAKKTGDPHAELVCSETGIDWFPVDNQNDAKRTRMRALYPWLLRGGLKFAAHCMANNADPVCKEMETLYAEFEKCLVSHHHDDIPDVIGQQFQKYAPRGYAAVLAEDVSAFSSSDPAWNIIFEEGCDPFGNIGFGPPTPTLDDMMTHEDEDMQADPYEGMPSILGTGFWG